jgi:hypothetical protein
MGDETKFRVHFLLMFFKPMKINFIAASSFGKDWRCLMTF